jgi:hypothetical protein
MLFPVLLLAVGGASGFVLTTSTPPRAGRAPVMLLDALSHTAPSALDSLPAIDALPHFDGSLLDDSTTWLAKLFPWEVDYQPSVFEAESRAPSVVPFLDDTLVIGFLTVAFPVAVTLLFIRQDP